MDCRFDNYDCYLNNNNNDLDGISFGQDTEGKWGYIPSGADTVIPFKSGGGSLYFPVINLNCTASANPVSAASGADVWGSSTAYFELNTESYSNFYCKTKSGTVKMIGTKSDSSTETITIAAATNYDISSYTKIRLTISKSTAAHTVQTSGWTVATYTHTGNVKEVTIS